MFDINDYDYELPPNLIAQVPAPRRDRSRLLVVDRQRRSLSDRHFFDLPLHLQPGDLLVVNDTKVVPARLFGRKESGGRVEILVLGEWDSMNQDTRTRTCLMRSSKGPKRGARLYFGSGVRGEIRQVLSHGLVSIRFGGDTPVDRLLETQGYMPLPPYIKRREGNGHSELDRHRYQTVFSKQKGAIAAPTAGLHFTRGLIQKLKQAGISITALTLHVGHGTFRAVRTRDIRQHQLGKEGYGISQEASETIQRARKGGGRIVAVGTTVVRALETAVRPDGSIPPGQGKTELMILPGFSFRAVDALITNFHLPKSSLLFLVSAFAGRQFTKAAYQAAIGKGYRFYSYGDAMLIL